MAITLMRGPIGSLSDGLMAGMRMNAMFAQNRALKARNEHDQDQLQIEKINADSLAVVRGSEKAAHDSAERYNNLRAEAIARSLEAGGPEAEVAASKQTTATAKSKQEDEAIRGIIPALDDDLDLNETAALASQIMTKFGVEPTPQNTQFYESKVQSEFQQMKQTNDRLKEHNLALMLQAQAGAAARVPAGMQEVLSSLGQQSDSIIKNIERNQTIIDFARTPEEANRARAANAKHEKSLADLHDRMRDIFISGFSQIGKVQQGRQQEQQPAATSPQTPPPPKVGEVVDGFEYIGGDPGDPDSWREVR